MQLKLDMSILEGLLSLNAPIEANNLPWIETEILPGDPLYTKCPWEKASVRQERIKTCFDIVSKFMIAHDRPQTPDDWKRVYADLAKLPYNRLISGLVAGCCEFWERELKEGVTRD